MPRKLPGNVAKKWVGGMQRATESMEAGVKAVTEAPGMKAAAAADKWAEGVRKAKESGKFARRASKTTLSEWQQSMIKKGIPRVSEGAAQAESEFAKFMGEFLPVAYASSDEIAGMPSGTKEASRARMNRNFDNISNFKRPE
jgi:hypothetical protein